MVAGAAIEAAIARFEAESPAVAVRPIEGGLWLTRGRDDALDVPSALRQPVGPGFTVVVGEPRAPRPAGAEVARLIRSFEPAVQATLAVCVLSDAPVPADSGCSAQAVADELGQPLRVLHGLPDGESGRTMVAEDWQPTWTVFAEETVYRPRTAPLVERWAVPVPGLVLAGPASYRLCPSWRLDVVPGGLLVRPDGMPAGVPASAPRPDQLQVLLAGLTGTSRPGAPLAALMQLLNRLPDSARARLQIAEVPPSGDGARRRWVPQRAARAPGHRMARSVRPQAGSARDTTTEQRARLRRGADRPGSAKLEPVAARVDEGSVATLEGVLPGPDESAIGRSPSADTAPVETALPDTATAQPEVEPVSWLAPPSRRFSADGRMWLATGAVATQPVRLPASA